MSDINIAGMASGSGSNEKGTSPSTGLKSALKAAMPARPDPAHRSSRGSKASGSRRQRPRTEVPFTESNLRRTRKSRGEGVKEQSETVMELIDQMRFGQERKVRTHSQTRAERSNPSNRARVESVGGGRFRVHWAKFKQRLGTGSAPSESLLDGTGTGASSTSSGGCAIKHGYAMPMEDELEEAMEVDQIVVDNDLGTTITDTPSQASEGDARTHTSGGDRRPEGSHTTSYISGPGYTLHYLWDRNPVFSFLRWTVWPLIFHFFSMRFGDDKMEHDFRKETWWTGKTLGLYSSAFFIVNWILAMALSSRPFSIADDIFYYGITAALSLPLPFVVIYDLPYKHKVMCVLLLIESQWGPDGIVF